MPTTIRDIKERTGLSLATISKYLNGGNVLPENRDKIQKAINELHYEVNEIARGLATKKTRTIGVMVYDISSMFCGALLHYVGEFLREKGYGVLICDSYNNEKTEEENLKFLLGKKVDGIIVMPVSLTDHFLKPALAARIPVVMLDRTIGEGRYDSIGIDNRKASIEAVEYLLKRNHKDIAIIGSRVEMTGIERVMGYRVIMEEYGVPLKEEYQKLGRHAIQFGYDSMKELLTMENPPTAVLMTNYELSLGAIMALQDCRKKTPEDISMIGFDDLILSQITQPKLMMVIQPMEELAKGAVDLVLNRIENGEEQGEGAAMIVLSARIKEGETVKTLF